MEGLAPHVSHLNDDSCVIPLKLSFKYKAQTSLFRSYVENTENRMEDAVGLVLPVRIGATAHVIR